MDQFGSNNTNDLQKAIDELNSGGASGGDASNSADNNNDVNAIKDTFGIPPAPAVGGAFPVEQNNNDGGNAENGASGNGGENNATENKDEKAPGSFGIGSMDDSVSASIDNAISSVGEPNANNADTANNAGITNTNDVASSAETTTPEATPAANPVVEATPTMEMAGGDLTSVKKDALKELVPLLDKTELSDEKKFEVYEDVINDNGDKSMIPRALEVARRLTDEKAKAEALLKVIRWIDGQ